LALARENSARLYRIHPVTEERWRPCRCGVAEDGDILKPSAPAAAKYVLDKSPGGLAS
jgi:hypothetical protein